MSVRTGSMRKWHRGNRGGREYPNHEVAGHNAIEPMNLVNELENPTLWSGGEGRCTRAQTTAVAWVVSPGSKDGMLRTAHCFILKILDFGVCMPPSSLEPWQRDDLPNGLQTKRAAGLNRRPKNFFNEKCRGYSVVVSALINGPKRTLVLPSKRIICICSTG